MTPENNHTSRYKEAHKKLKKIKGFYVHLLVYLVINIFILVANTREDGILEGLGELSNYSTAFFWGIGVIGHWAIVFGGSVFLGKDWEERKIKELMDREQKGTWE